MTLEEVEQILKKYQPREAAVSKLLDQCSTKRNDSDFVDENLDRMQEYDFRKAQERNKGILKELEAAKGRLRSKAIYSPSEMQWATICKTYQNEPALVVTTWRCHLPVFV